jgi:hypothetical protein
MQQGDSAARIVVRTGGAWRASQFAETLTALDGVATRVAVASQIAETCQQFDYVISNFRVLGLLEKGAPENWRKPDGPQDVIGRTDWVKFVSLMRTMGVGVDLAPDSLKFNFLVPDLLDLAPSSARPEIERIRMASPGTLSLLLTGILGKKQCVSLLERIFDFLVAPKAGRAKRAAEAREAKAKARLAEARAKQQETRVASELVRLQREQVNLLFDYTAAIDSLVITLRNAGFDNSVIKSALQDRVMKDIDVLCRQKSIGLIESVRIKPLVLKDSSPPPADNVL